jgi:hypothetical protein
MPARVHVGMTERHVEELAGRIADAAVKKLKSAP